MALCREHACCPNAFLLVIDAVKQYMPAHPCMTTSSLSVARGYMALSISANLRENITQHQLLV